MMEEKQYKMQEAVSILRVDYEGINASAIRFWEKEGLVNPSRDTSDHRRRYNEKDLDIIRFIKDLSNFGYSLDQIGKELSSVKNKIESEKIDQIKPELYSTTYVAKIFMHYRSRIRLAMKFKLYLNMNKSAKHIPTFERSILEKRLEYDIPGNFIKDVDKLKITKPKEMDKGFFYSSCDEAILETLIYILEEEKDFLERCHELISTFRYLYEKIGLTARFAAGPLMSLDLSTYKALLYNLIQERFSHEEK